MKHKYTLIFFIIVLVCLATTYCILIQRENLVMNEKDRINDFMKLFSQETIKKFPPKKPGLLDYAKIIKKTTKPTELKYNKEKIEIPPLVDDFLNDPLIKRFKTKIISPSPKMEKFDFPRNMRNMRNMGKFKPELKIPPRFNQNLKVRSITVPDLVNTRLVDAIRSARYLGIQLQIRDTINTSDQNLNNKIKAQSPTPGFIFNDLLSPVVSVDVYELGGRFARNRVNNMSNNDIVSECMIDDIQPSGTWTEKVRGLVLYDKKMYTCNQNTISKFHISSNNTVYDENIQEPIRSDISFTCNDDNYGFGQGSVILQENNRANNMIIPVFCGNLNYTHKIINLNTLNTVENINLGISSKWVAVDPITKYTFIPDGVNVTSLLVFNINSSSRNEIITEFNLVDQDNNDYVLNNCIAGTFLKNGLLCLLSDNRNKPGISVFAMEDGKFVLLNNYRNFSTDQHVGLASHDNTLVLLCRNNDLGTDNISFYRITFKEFLPRSFSWNNETDTYLYKGSHTPISTIRNQQRCGSCWAFASTGALADRYAVMRNREVNLSASRLLACDLSLGHCNGAYSTEAFNALSTIGTTTESCWDYNWCDTSDVCERGSGSEFGVNWDSELINSLIPSCTNYRNTCVSCVNSTGTQQCNIVNEQLKTYKSINSSYRLLTGPMEMAIEIFNNGPIIGSFMVYNDFIEEAFLSRNFRNTRNIYCRVPGKKFYSWWDEGNEMVGGHAVEIIGWGVESMPDPADYVNFDVEQYAVSEYDTYDGFAGAPVKQIPYWICKNSWGADCFTYGYVKIAWADENTGLNVDLHIDKPLGTNILFYSSTSFGSVSLAADLRYPS